MIYLAILLITIYLSCRYDEGSILSDTNHTHSNREAKLFIFLAFISAINYNLGGDTPFYVSDFLDSKDLSHISFQYFTHSRFQPGWQILISTFRSITDNYIYYQIFHAILINLGILLFLRKYSSAFYLSTLCYLTINYLEFNFEIQRESFCVIIALLVFHLWENNHKGWCILFTILAFFIHKSAIVILFYPLINLIKLNRKNFVIFFVLSIITPYLWTLIPNANLLMELATGGEETFQKYVNQQINENFNLNYYIIYALSNLIFPFVVLFFAMRNRKSRCWPYILVYIFVRMLSVYSYGFYRITNYFIPFYWIGIGDAMIYIYHKYKIRKFVLCSLICIVLLYIYQNHLLAYESDRDRYVYERYLPYVTIFENSYIK